MNEDRRAQLARLEDAVGRTGAALLALEDDPTVRMLDASALSGETAHRWGALAGTRAALFRAHHELSDVVERAVVARPRDVAALLAGHSVVRSDVTRPVAARGLLDDSRIVERCSPEQLLADMEAGYSDVRAVVAAVEAAWSTAMAWANRSRQRVETAGADAAALDGPSPASLAGLRDEVNRLAAAALADPLGWTAVTTADVDERLDRAEEELVVARALRDDWTGQLAAAGALLEDLRDAVAATDAVASIVASRIVGASGDRLDDPTDHLTVELDALAERIGARPWWELAEELADWRGSVDRACAAVIARGDDHRSRLDERDELRARLEAYEAKAAALGLLEDQDLASCRRRAHDALFRAPTDLLAAAGLVAAYGDQVRERSRR